MMQQYFKIKEENKDSILFFRLGDFYEMFYDDAKLAGIPQSVISRAKEILKDLEHGKYKNENASIQKQDNSDNMQLSLIGAAESPVVERLKNTDINTLTPIEAMNLLYELKGMI